MTKWFRYGLPHGFSGLAPLASTIEEKQVALTTIEALLSTSICTSKNGPQPESPRRVTDDLAAYNIPA